MLIILFPSILEYRSLGLFFSFHLSIVKNPPFEKGGEGGISVAGLYQKSPPRPPLIKGGKTRALARASSTFSDRHGE